jgi:transposase
MAWRAVTDQQWELIKAQLPRRKRRTQGGRPPANDRQCVEGVLWILWTGAPWSERERYGAKSTIHRRLTAWAESDVLLNMWRAFLDQLEDRQKVRWDECFIDGLFSTAKQGGRWLGRRKEARAQRSWYGPMARVLRAEYTWRRLPPRRSHAWSRRCRTGASGAAVRSAARPSGCLLIGATTATPGERGWSRVIVSRSSRRGRLTEWPRTRTAEH